MKSTDIKDISDLFITNIQITVLIFCHYIVTSSKLQNLKFTIFSIYNSDVIDEYNVINKHYVIDKQKDFILQRQTKKIELVSLLIDKSLNND